MLTATSTIASAATATSASAVSSAAMTATGITINFETIGTITMVFLISLLIAHELCSTWEGRKSRQASHMLNVMTASLFSIFLVITGLKVFLVI